MADSDDDVVRSVNMAARLGCASMPYLTGIAAQMRVSVDDRVATAGVFASGRLLVNRTWFAALRAGDACFVVAHEMLHLALQSHARAAGTDARLFNIAHDYVINDMLENALQMRTPADGLRQEGARFRSAEDLAHKLGERIAAAEPDPFWHPRAQPWQQHTKPPPPPTTTTALGLALQQAGRSFAVASKPEAARLLLDAEGDLFSEELEASLFPDEARDVLRARCVSMQTAALHSVSLKLLHDRTAKLFPAGATGNTDEEFRALQSAYQGGWEAAMQPWLDGVAPGRRTWSRASRRGAERQDVILAGRRRDGWLLCVVLDVSASMHGEMSRALGVIAKACDAVGVDVVRVVECDVTVSADACLSPAELELHRIRGFGGTELTPALERLAEDADVHAVVVITDSEREIAPRAWPFEVFCLLTTEVIWKPVRVRIVPGSA